MKREDMAKAFTKLIESAVGERTVECEGFTVSLGDPLTQEKVDSAIPEKLLSLFESAIEAYNDFLSEIPPSDDEWGFQEREFHQTQATESELGYAIAICVSRDVPWPRSES